MNHFLQTSNTKFNHNPSTSLRNKTCDWAWPTN
jgi:hypothetical protein